MTRYPVWTVFVVIAALVVGCEPAKELPTDVPKVDGAPVPQHVAPAQSDPDAKAIIDRAVKALTGGKPEQLAKGKASSVALKGQMYAVDNSNASIEATRSMTAVWPNKLHFVNESQPFNNKLVVESWLRRPDLIVFNNGLPHLLGNVADAEQNLASDAVGQHWMIFLLPLVDPKAVIFDLQSITFDRRELHRMKLSLGEFPLYQLTFDAKTDTLFRVEYTNAEIGVTRRTTMIYSNHKAGPEGFVLPHGIECRHNGAVVEKWTVEKWELPAAIKDEEFSPPKKK